MKRFQKGFTLIELLVVIAVLGILAAGLLATVDPLEQMKKGRDTTTRSTVVELYNAVIRYNANTGKMPWVSGSGMQTCYEGRANSVAAQPIGSNDFVTDCVNGLVVMGELKTQFTSAINAATDKMFVFGDTEIASLCFLPESKSIRNDPATRFKTNLTEGGCTYGPAVSTCYWCAQ